MIEFNPQTATAVLGWLGFIFSLAKWLRERKLLPAKVQAVVDQIGIDRFLTLIVEAKQLAGRDNEERMNYVVDKLDDYCDRADIAVPDGALRVGAEWIYQKYAKGRKL